MKSNLRESAIVTAGEATGADGRNWIPAHIFRRSWKMAVLLFGTGEHRLSHPGSRTEDDFVDKVGNHWQTDAGAV
jgi:hypothetical protein